MDLALLQALAAASTAICFFTVLTLRRMDPQEPSLPIWLRSIGLLWATMMVSAARVVIPPDVAIIAANILGAIGFFYFLQAMRVLLRRPPLRRVLVPSVAAVAVYIVWFTVVTPSVAARLILMSVTCAAVFMYCAWILLHHREAGLRNVMTVASALFAATGLAYAVRAVAIPFVEIPQDYLGEANLVIGAMYIMTILDWALAAVILSFIVATRVHYRLAEAVADADEANLRLLEMSWLDPGTKTTNRSRIAGVLSGGVESHASFGVPMAAILVTIEGPRRLGLDPRTSDLTMSQVADFLREGLGLDGPDFETIGRWGDDAFLVVLMGASRNDALGGAHRVASLLDRCEDRAGWESYQIGVTQCQATDSVEKLLDRLYSAAYESQFRADTVQYV